MKQLFSVLSAILLFASCKNSNTADTIIHHAKIYTVDSAFSIAEAMVVKDGKIVAIGKNEDILKAYSAKEIISGLLSH